jgi:crossover junction endodeoxyribonuclease RusA
VTFEFIVDGPPVSQQTRRRERYHEWKRHVRSAAERFWTVGVPPLTGSLAVTILYFFEGAAGDVDNIVKPIHDAMGGLVYGDDAQVSDSIARRRDLFGEFTIVNVTPVLAQGLQHGREFLYVFVSPAPTGGGLDV